jgi:magnesium-transporting ATPase (P-type)
MTDELELLKKDWQKKEENLPKLSYAEIHQMIWKKSSSIVKWILIISILEITLPNLLYLIPSMQENSAALDDTYFNTYYYAIMAVYYLVVIYFVYLFYRRYKEISVLDNAKNLMHKIIRTRKTVKYYIIFSLFTIFVMFVVIALGIWLNDDHLKLIPDLHEKFKDLSPLELKSKIAFTLAIGGAIMLVLAAGIYFLLYGLLLRKLKKNHNELKKLEI